MSAKKARVTGLLCYGWPLKRGVLKPLNNLTAGLDFWLSGTYHILHI